MHASLRGICFATWILSSFVLVQPPVLLRAQEPMPDIPTIKVDVALVTTDVTVIGAAAAELEAEDFIVYDNGVAQRVNHFSRDRLPLAIALIIDRSSSIRPYLSLLQKAAVSALGRLKPEDPVALFAFDDDLLKLSDLTVDRNRIADIIGKVTIGNGTNIYDAISDVAAYLRRRAPHYRRAIILVSDNCHTVKGRIDVNTVRGEVLESPATLYSIRTPGNNYAANSRVSDPACHDSIRMVRRLAEETGGQILDLKDSASLQEALEKAISDLRLQYTLGFSPSDQGEEGSFHKLTVKLASEKRCPSCRLLARSGYYAGSTPASALSEFRTVSPEPANKPDQWAIRRKIESANTMDLDLLDIPFAASAAKQQGSSGEPQVGIGLQIDFTGVGFQTIGDRRKCRLHIGVFPTDEKGGALEPQFRILEGTLQEETHKRILKTGMAVSFEIPAKASKQNLKIILYDEVNDTFGSQRTQSR